MLAIERRNKILAILQQEKRVLVNDLSSAFQVTEETIRRDLEKLEKEGFAKKTYGGAILNESLNVDLPYTVRKKANVSNKQCIAEIISSLVEDGDHIMMDASSTAVYAAKHLKNKKNITIITNSIEILLELSEVAGWKVLSTGGVLKEGSLSLVGYQAEEMLSNYHVDKAIISCKGIDIEKGFTDSNEMDAHIKKLMLNSANVKILAVDNSKFNKISFTKIGDLSELDVLITDSEPDDKWKQAMASAEVKVLYKENKVPEGN
ncbi:putative HTH-type transcriptional regulator YulB [Anaerocolumna cellulosilytica]|uniref:Putative HTH-type transcriptional regulator YulB n=1 Tax=Anaerocolumna cellulosilytica TaxID=433286 RepID=A0A6S6R6G3_9FIRM|nr:DeoR/GlpR family DNA-binding transcription regulator [Anaerocolumna cellulosilytica]MBB5194177.1 DeoR/GlpR family transcriptional regulator of sugar metabolism [Anaerocolumna cellulosilytica]BCJ94611.1 putative HTH-type transcriptional regulator YulB [Anaerocolumna cellulosilytica]